MAIVGLTSFNTKAQNIIDDNTKQITETIKTNKENKNEASNQNHPSIDLTSLDTLYNVSVMESKLELISQKLNEKHIGGIKEKKDFLKIKVNEE